jgi:putative flippase GtrA
MSREPSVRDRGPRIRSVAGYLTIGLASVAVDFGLLVLLHERAGLGVRLSASVAFGTSLVFNFLLNRWTIIGTAARHFGGHAFRYGLLVLLNYIFLLACLTIAAKAGVSYLLAKGLVVIGSTLWNYVLYRRWVFTAPDIPVQAKQEGRPIPRSAPQVAGYYGDLEPLLVVIPAYNEEDVLGQVVHEVRAELPEAAILVVDDASTDATRRVALSARADVLSLPFNLGVGGAMRAGFRYAVRYGYRSVLQVDADGQHDPRDARRLLAALAEADLVIGARFAGAGRYKVQGPRQWAMTVLSRVLSRSAGSKLTDTTSGFRASGPRAVELFARHYPAEYLGDTVESIVISCRHGLVVRQVPASMRERLGGKPSQNAWRASIYLLRACMALCLAGVRWRGDSAGAGEGKNSGSDPSGRPSAEAA